MVLGAWNHSGPGRVAPQCTGSWAGLGWAGLGRGGPWIPVQVRASAGKAARLGCPGTAGCCQGPGLLTGLLWVLPERLGLKRRRFRLSRAWEVFCWLEDPWSLCTRGPDPDITSRGQKNIKELEALF